MATVELKKVSKRFGAHDVIRGIDLRIHDREFVAFVGPSGSGKSTLLRMIAGLEEVSEGEVLIDDVPVQHVPPSRRGLAMVFQSYALYPHMTVAENMSFNLRLAGISKEEQDKKVRAVARVLEMEPLLDRKPRQLSGGQMQRVAIGRAMVRQPKAFLFDEPLSNLDAALQAQMRMELVRLHHELNTTMIYVTHDQLEAMTMADRIVVLNNGAVEQVGTPLDLYQHPATLFVAGFIGAPKMNFLEAVTDSVNANHLVLTLANNATITAPARSQIASAGQRLTLGIRPEHIVVDPQGELACEVQVLEHLGARAYIHARMTDGVKIVALTDADTPLRPGREVRFQIRPEMVHLFEINGRSLTAPALQGI